MNVALRAPWPYTGLGDVNLNQEDWESIYAQMFNVVTTWIDCAGGYQFPLDGSFDMERLDALISIVYNNIPTPDEIEALTPEATALGWTGDFDSYAFMKKLGFMDDDQVLAFESATGIDLPTMSELMRSGRSPEEFTQELYTRAIRKFPWLESEESLTRHASSLPVPPGRTEAWKRPDVKGKAPWWHYALAAGGGAVGGVVIGALIGRAIKR